MDTTKVLMSLDIYRDGGSLSVSYDCDGVGCTLMFHVRHELGSQRSPHYGDPTVIECQPCPWTSPTTGITYNDYKRSTREASWTELLEILQEFKIQIEGFKSDCVWVFDEMLNIAANEGVGISRNSSGQMP